MRTRTRTASSRAAQTRSPFVSIRRFARARLTQLSFPSAGSSAPHPPGPLPRPAPSANGTEYTPLLERQKVVLCQIRNLGKLFSKAQHPVIQINRAQRKAG